MHHNKLFESRINGSTCVYLALVRLYGYLCECVGYTHKIVYFINECERSWNVAGLQNTENTYKRIGCKHKHKMRFLSFSSFLLTLPHAFVYVFILCFNVKGVQNEWVFKTMLCLHKRLLFSLLHRVYANRCTSFYLFSLRHFLLSFKLYVCVWNSWVAVG